jgi:hypothetical protein
MKKITSIKRKQKQSILILLFSLLFMISIIPYSVLGQSVKISDNGSTHINPGAILDLESNSKGLLIPGMSMTDIINNIPPHEGILVYNTTDQQLMFFNAFTGLWEPVGFYIPNPSEKIIDSDFDSYITVEQGIDDDTIHYYIAGTEQWRMTGKALEPINSGSSVFIGEGAGKNDAQDNQNVFIGRHAGFSTTTGSFNTAIGHNAFESNITGAGNTAIGNEAMLDNTTGYSNVAIGADALLKNKTVSNLVAIGDSALHNNGASSFGFQGYWNTAVGSKSLLKNTIGFGNSAFGYQSLYTNTSGQFNTALGGSSLYSNTTGSSNTAVGISALYTNSTGSNNLAFGLSALNGNQTGNSNIGMGVNALFNNLTGTGNTAIGTAALYSSTNISGNVAIGDSSLYNNGTGATGFLGSGNTAIGKNTMFSNTTGYYNTAVGYKTLQSNSSGIENTMVGYAAGQSISNGNYNTFLGAESGINSQGGGYNVFIGSWAGKGNTSGSSNVYIGDDAGVNNQIGSSNVLIGENAGNGNQSSNNVMVGQNSGYTNNSGSGNVFLGYQAGYNESGSDKLYIENSNSTTPLIYGDFGKDSININGKTSITNNLHVGGNLYVSGEIKSPVKVGYTSVPPAAFQLTNEKIKDVVGNTCVSTDPDKIVHEQLEYHMTGYFKNRMFLKEVRIGIQDKTYLYAPVYLPHGAQIKSFTFSFEWDGASAGVKVCPQLVRSSLITGALDGIQAIVMTSSGVDIIERQTEVISTPQLVDNDNYVYSIRIPLPHENVAGNGGIVGASVKYTYE